METALRFHLLPLPPPQRPLQPPLFLSSSNPFFSPPLRSPSFKLEFRSAATSQQQRKAELQQDEPIKSVDDDVGNSGIIISACVVGVLTGVAVVIFNNAVHEIRDLFWDGITYRGASWLREEPLQSIWFRVISVPTCGGFIVALFTWLQSLLTHDSNYKAAITPFLKSLSACFTLGTGNSLGPEGPSVEIGANIAKVVSSFKLFPITSQFKLSLLAAGSAAGISSGFNAAVAGCFFAVESVLWPSQTATSSLTNTTSMVILSAVTASVISEVGLGSEPAFKVPEYDFRSPGELPLYLLLGILCGLVSLTLTKCTSFFSSTVDNVQKASGIPRPAFPVLGGLANGVIALAFPEILYWGFQNVDILLESRPFVKGLPAELLFQLVGVKIITTSFSRASGLVGGYYAPSLFIGAATGMAYGKFIGLALDQSHPTLPLSLLEVASPQAYGLVGMAATLAGVCQVPLTAVLLLFELTQDYRIVLPLLGAVGLSSWITSGQTRRDTTESTKTNEGNSSTVQPKIYSPGASEPSSADVTTEKASSASDLCEVESSLCLYDSTTDPDMSEMKILVSEAMRTRYVTVSMSSLLTEAVTFMLLEKQSCAMIVDNNNILIGFLTLGDIEEFSKTAKAEGRLSKELLVSEMFALLGEKCRVQYTAMPNMDLLSVKNFMDRHYLSQVPVVSDNIESQVVGLLDTECITVTWRALSTRESLR